MASTAARVVRVVLLDVRPAPTEHDRLRLHVPEAQHGCITRLWPDQESLALPLLDLCMSGLICMHLNLNLPPAGQLASCMC
jgi:hypothetical protein